MKLWKLHTLVFRCPCCGKDADYAAQIVEGPNKGTLWDPAYWCEKCSSAVRARDTWLFGAVYGPLMAMVATFAMQAVPPGIGLARMGAARFRGALLRDRRLAAFARAVAPPRLLGAARPARPAARRACARLRDDDE